MFRRVWFYYGSGEPTAHHDAALMQLPMADSHPSRVGLFASSDGLLLIPFSACVRASAGASCCFGKCRMLVVVGVSRAVKLE